ncbi:MAG: cell division protein SepF [Clostridia bacterium]|nr:cell division protein SepF [Clostridia bacterium]
MAIKLPGFSNKRKEDESYYDSYYSDGYDDKEQENAEQEGGNVSFDDSDVKEVAHEEPKSAFGGINEEAVSLKVMAPKSYSEATKVADSLIAGSTVVLNVEALDKAEMIRFMDFLMGILYVIHGNMKNVSKTTVVVSPSSIADESDAQDE